MNNRLLSALIVIGVAGAPADADVNINPIDGDILAAFAEGQVHGLFFHRLGTGDGPGSGAAFNLYNNIPEEFGGLAHRGFFGPFGTFLGTFGFLDWTGASAAWGDDVHELSIGGLGTAFVTRLWYAYFNSNMGLGAGTVTHVVKIYDMVPPGMVPPVTTLIQKGALLASIVLPQLPAAPQTRAYSVSVSGLAPIALPHSSVWIKFEESGPAAPGTFWLTGGEPSAHYVPGYGDSHPGVLRSQPFVPPYPYNLWVDYPFFVDLDVGYIASNISLGLGGFHVPGPAAISVLGLGGLLALRRRRPAFRRG